MKHEPPDLKMKRPGRRRIFWLLGAGLLLFMAAVWVWLGPANDPKLSVTYLGLVDGNGHWRMQVGITNVGNRTVFTSALGGIEISNQTNRVSVGASKPKSKLGPGEGHVVEAVLSEGDMELISDKWRYACSYARDGLRSRIYRWQWGPGGPGARANWLVPTKLKGIRLDVVGRSEWMDPPDRSGFIK